MSWVRRTFGLDAFNLVLHGAVTGILLFWIAAENSRPDAIVLGSAMSVASLVVLGIRRQLALRKAEREELPREMEALRIAELEQRMAELEADRQRIAELEERLDFAERMLAQGALEPRHLGPGKLQ